MAVGFYPISRTEGSFFNPQSLVPWPFPFGLEMLAILPLAFSRIRPGLAAGIMAFSCLCQVLSGVGPGMSAFAVPLMVYACAKYGSRRVSLGYLIVALLGAGLLGLFLLVTPLLNFPEMAPDLVWALFMMLVFSGFAAAVVLVAWLFGDMAGRRRRELAAITERNELLERERDHEARLAADAERMRIAREMHDVISHSMSVMIAQSDGGRYVVDHDAGRAAQAFETIGDTGREALSELRRMLGVLREESEARRRPAPGLRELPQLLEDVRASGLMVEADVKSPVGKPAEKPAEKASAMLPPAGGSRDEASSGGLVEFAAAVGGLPTLPEGVGLAAYRIVQEALTNTLKHAGGEARATVRVGVVEDEAGGAGRVLTVEIRDTGLGSRASGDGAGSGLLGMQERARLYGGVVETRAHEGGFDVAARFPLQPGVELVAEASDSSVASEAAEARDAGRRASAESEPGAVPGAQAGSRTAGSPASGAGRSAGHAAAEGEGKGSDEL